MTIKLVRVYLNIIFASVFFLLSHSVCAEQLKEHTKIWTDFSNTGSITRDHKWKYYIEPQLRFIDDKYKFDQANLFLGGGYQASTALKFWLGIFRRYQIESDGSSNQEYRLWGQIDWAITDLCYMQLSSRSRVEERKNFIHAQIANRFRERLKAKIPLKDKRYFLVVADEVFLQINKPEWVVNRTFSENRASIGVEILADQFTSYEIGYLNQYQYTKPNQMSNVLYIGLSVDAE